MIDFFEHFLHEFDFPLKNPVLIFSLILVIILLSPILLRKLNIPGIIGLIISGVIVGPHGLNMLEKNSAIDLFSTIGLLYIMFIAGLDLDMAEFKANKNKSLLFGFFTFILPISIGFPVCKYLLGYDLNASLLVASMFATHTLVAYPIVSKLGVAKNQAVAITVGGTILTDSAVLIILAIIMGNSQGQLTQEFWLRLGMSLAIFMVIMFLIIPRISKWFFQKLESEKHAHYIFVLSVVFFAAFLAEASGVEPIIGAFVAGLALNPLIPNSSALMNRIEFIGNSLFIPFFLISVGMLVDIRVILNGTDAVIVAATLTVVALIGKWLAALLSQLLFKYSNAQRQLIFGLSSSHAAATLAIILVGYKAEILDENILNGTIILILVTCIVASFVTEKAARKIVVSEVDDEIPQTKSSSVFDEHILMPVANIDNLNKLMEFAILIKDKKSANPITILSVVPNNEEAEINILKSRSKLVEFVKQAAASEIKVNTIAAIDHNTASGIARSSRELMVDIIILGWPQKTDFFDKIFGEKVEAIINNVDKNLFVCHFSKPLINNNRLVMILSPLAEKESGFEILLRKIVRISKEFRMPIVCFGNEKTHAAVRLVLEKKKIKIKPVYKPFTDWEDFLILAREIEPNDLLILNSARKGSISYLPILEKIPFKLEKHFSENNIIIMYPQNYDNSDMKDIYEDISSSPLTRGIGAIEQIGKGIGQYFKKDKND